MADEPSDACSRASAGAGGGNGGSSRKMRSSDVSPDAYEMIPKLKLSVFALLVVYMMCKLEEEEEDDDDKEEGEERNYYKRLAEACGRLAAASDYWIEFDLCVYAMVGMLFYKEHNQIESKVLFQEVRNYLRRMIRSSELCFQWSCDHERLWRFAMGLTV